MSRFVERMGKAVLMLSLLAALALSPVFALAQDAEVAPYEPPEGVEDLTGTIEVDGSSTVGPITEAIAEDFRAVAPDVRVTVNISGTGGGFKRFCTDETDIQDASRPISESEIEECAENGVDYYRFQVAIDGLSVVVNPDNDWADCMTVEELQMLWAPGTDVETWSDIRPEWPEETVNLYGPGPDSGTFDYFNEAIIGEESSRTDFTASEDDNVLVEGVAGDTYALGYFGLAYYEQNPDRLSLVAIDNGDGCVEPSEEAVADGSYAPLSRPIFVYVKAPSLDRPEVQEFVRFYLATVDDLILEVGYVGAGAASYASDQEKLEAAIAGEIEPDSASEDEA